MNQILLFNLAFCAIIFLLSIWWCLKAGSSVPLLIGIAFLLFGVSHVATVLDLTTEFRVHLIVIRSTAYVLVAVGMLLTTLGIVRRKKAEDELKRSHEELEQRVKDRTSELADANESLISEINTRRLAEEEVRLSERRLLDIIDFLPDPTVSVDLNGVVIAWNRAMEEMTGVRAADMLGKENCEYSVPFYGERRPMLLDFILKPDPDIEKLYPGIIQRTGRSIIAEASQIHLQGRDVSLWAKAGPLFDIHGNITGAIETIRDITDRKKAEEALRQANRKLNLLSDITRHDINNQIHALKAYMSLSTESLEDASRMREYIAKEEQALNSIEHQIGFTKEYRDLGLHAPIWQQVAACIESAGNALPLGGVRIEPHVAGLEVYADPMLEKVFYSLIENALRHGGERLSILSINFSDTETGLVITVEDDGIGVPPENKPLIFNRGFGHRTGFGLFLSREILSITGITIAETGRPPSGARFEISVPGDAWRWHKSGP